MFARRPQWQTNSEQFSWDCTGGNFVNGVLKYIAHFLSCQSKAQKLEKYKIKIIWCVNRYQFKQWVLLIIKYTKTVKMSKRTYGMIISGEFFLSPNTIAKFICLDLPFRFPHSHFIDRILIYFVTVRLSKFLIPANDIQKSFDQFELLVRNKHVWNCRFRDERHFSQLLLFCTIKVQQAGAGCFVVIARE